MVTSVVVYFEVYFVVRLIYGKDRERVSQILSKMLNLSIELEERDLLVEAIYLYQHTPLSLEDCYHLVFAKKCLVSELKTFDKKLERTFKTFS